MAISNMIKAAIFDLDGTLIDSVDAHALAWQESLKFFGKDVSFEKVRSQIGKGGDQLMPVFLSRLELSAFGKDLETYRTEHFRHNYLPTLKPFPMIREMLIKVHQNVDKIIIASSSNRLDLDTMIHIAQIKELIDDSVSGDDADRSKPTPDIYFAALKALGVDGRDAISIGDSPYDAIAASQAGIRSIGVLSGGFMELELRAAGCIEIYRDPADLYNRLDQSLLGLGMDPRRGFMDGNHSGSWPRI